MIKKINSGLPEPLIFYISTPTPPHRPPPLLPAHAHAHPPPPPTTSTRPPRHSPCPLQHPPYATPPRPCPRPLTSVAEPEPFGAGTFWSEPEQV